MRQSRHSLEQQQQQQKEEKPEPYAISSESKFNHQESYPFLVEHEVGCINLFLIRIVGGGVQTGPTRHVGHLLAYCTCPGWLWGWRIGWNEWKGKPKYSEKTYPSATLSTTNPTWPDLGSNPGRRGGKSATNRLSFGAAK
jgi:hypothetical protein